ncbi:pilus assembly PilX N-terminal domain-containing protein [Thalassotalea piscium]
MSLKPIHVSNIHTQAMNTSHRQQGSALVIAIFVIIVMTLLGTALVRMLSSEAETVAYEVIGTRAFQAAQSGMQWQLQQVFPLNSKGIACPFTAITRDFTNSGDDGKGLKNCKAKLRCSDFDDSSGDVKYYQLESTGICDIAGVETLRTISVDARTIL